MNAKQQRDEAVRLRLDADAKRKEADRFTYNANDYDKADDPVKADTERTEAAKRIEDARRADQEADTYEQGAAEQEAQALAIDQQQSALQSAHDQRMKELESKKVELRGGVGLFS